MGHGTPDWWGTEPTATVHKVSDLGELAARLGSIDTFDRRGDVVWLSGFEDGLAEFIPVRTGAGSDRNISTTTACKGAYSLKLTIGSNAEDMSGVEKWVPYPALSGFGGEVSFTWNTGLDRLEIWLILYDGTNRTYFAVNLSQTNGKIYYRNSAGGWTEIDSLPAWATATDLFHVAKLAIDLSTGKYMRLTLDNTGYSLAGISAEAPLSAVQPNLLFSVRAYGPGVTTPTIYVDDMIITQNEP